MVVVVVVVIVVVEVEVEVEVKHSISEIKVLFVSYIVIYEIKYSDEELIFDLDKILITEVEYYNIYDHHDY